MTRTPVSTRIGFADAEITDYSKRGGELLVGVKAWNEERLVVCFEELAAMCDRGAWSVSDLCESSIQSSLLLEALEYQYDEIPEDHGMKVFEFLDNDGNPILEVIARKASVSRDADSPSLSKTDSAKPKS